PFLQHAGIASLNLGYGGEDGGGIYRSIYDDFKWFTSFDDTSFAYGRALAQTMGTAVMRLANAELLPYDFTGLAETVGRYTREVQKLLKDKQDSVREQNREIDEGVFTATNDPREPLVSPPDLRARLLHGLWGEDAARRARSDRAEELEGSRRSDPAARPHARRRGGPRQPGRGAAGEARAVKRHH